MKSIYVSVTVIRLVLSILVLSVSVILSASDGVRITFPHSVVGMVRHGNLLVVIHYPVDEKNKQVEMIWSSLDGEEGRSVIDVNSENNGIPVVKDLNVSAGEYLFVVTLYRSDGSKAVATEIRFIVRH